MFNDKPITIKKRRSQPTINEYGVASYEWDIVGTYLVDVQPISQEKCKMIFGSYPNVKYQVWLDDKVEGFNTTNFRVEYKGTEYEVLCILEWDDDWHCLNFVLGVDDIGS